jgi:hypothetical protein
MNNGRRLSISESADYPAGSRTFLSRSELLELVKPKKAKEAK